MKRLISCLLSAALLLSLCACTTQQDEFEDPVSFYYLQVQLTEQIHHGSVHSVITPEIREGKQLRQDLTQLLKQYLAGPGTETVRSPFPAGTSLIGWEMDGTTLCITLSDDIANLTGIDMTLACACLAKTCLEFGQYGSVRIRAESLSLDGKVSITINESILLLLDDTVPVNEQNGN